MTAIVERALYNQLPSLNEANELREDQRIDDIINGPIRDVFLKYAVHLTHCLYLQHRHHEIGNGEAVVKVEGTAHLMDQKDMNDIISFGNKIVPTTWMTSDDNVVPMEFASVPIQTEMPAFPPGFLAEFASILATHGCGNRFGVDTIAKSDWSEMKIGNASVVVPSSSDSYDHNQYIPVAFAFDETKPTFTVHGKCGKDHKHSSKPKKN